MLPPIETSSLLRSPTVFRTYLLATAILVANLLMSAPHALEISPLKLVIDAEEGVGTFRLTNSKDTTALFNSKVFKWNNSKDFGSFEETEEIMVVPPIFELGPNEVQTIRVALREPGKYESERTFRLLTTEVVPDVGNDDGIAFQFRMNVPIFVTPPDAEPEAIWQIKSKSDGTSQLTLINHGTAHVQLNELSLIAVVNGDQIFETKKGGYVFGGEQRSWIVNSQPDSIEGPLIVRAVTNRGTIEAQIALSGS